MERILDAKFDNFYSIVHKIRKISNLCSHPAASLEIGDLSRIAGAESLPREVLMPLIQPELKLPRLMNSMR